MLIHNSPWSSPTIITTEAHIFVKSTCLLIISLGQMSTAITTVAHIFVKPTCLLIITLGHMPTIKTTVASCKFPVAVLPVCLQEPGAPPAGARGSQGAREAVQVRVLWQGVHRGDWLQAPHEIRPHRYEIPPHRYALMHSIEGS